MPGCQINIKNKHQIMFTVLVGAFLFFDIFSRVIKIKLPASVYVSPLFFRMAVKISTSSFASCLSAVLSSPEVMLPSVMISLSQ